MSDENIEDFEDSETINDLDVDVENCEIIEDAEVLVGSGKDYFESFLQRKDFSSLHQMMDANYLEYASYVIRDRAIPDIDDGLKPVQRRILHSLIQIHDGKFHKVANVVGHTMKYHPHGDASIYEALVNLANKDFFIDKQGNFGNVLTGDMASAARYIECRLYPFALDVLFNKSITQYIDSYDGRNQEPVLLPAKVPVLLMMGADGIGVGMATKIMPHNFIELLQAQVALINGEEFELYPDFQQGGIIDVSDYQQGNGRLKVRALLEISDDKSIRVKEIPATVTTEKLIDSIEKATKKSKIKVSAINDFTAENVDIEVVFQRGVNVEKAVDALYAFTDCEVKLSPNLVVIKDNMPAIMSVNDVLKRNTEKLAEVLRLELELELKKNEDLFHAKTLEQIFIEERVYKLIEDCKSYEAVTAAVQNGLKPFIERLRREITLDDVERLLEIRIKRISQFDIDKNRKDIEQIITLIDELLKNLCNLKRYTIHFLKRLIEQNRKKYPRRSRIEIFKQIDVKNVALKNVKVGYDRSTGMLGRSVKSEDSITCNEFDRILLFNRKDGTARVLPIPDKLYVGKGLEFYKANKDQVYSMIYRDKSSNGIYAKRFRVASYIMEKDYPVVPKGCRIEKIYTTYGAIVRCEYDKSRRLLADNVDIIFDTVAMRSISARGIKITDKKIEKFTLVESGTETPTTPIIEEETDETDETGNNEIEEVADDREPKRILLNKTVNEIFSQTRERYKGISFSGSIIELEDENAESLKSEKNTEVLVIEEERIIETEEKAIKSVKGKKTVKIEVAEIILEEKTKKKPLVEKIEPEKIILEEKTKKKTSAEKIEVAEIILEEKTKKKPFVEKMEPEITLEEKTKKKPFVEKIEPEKIILEERKSPIFSPFDSPENKRELENAKKIEELRDKLPDSEKKLDSQKSVYKELTLEERVKRYKLDEGPLLFPPE